MLSGVRMTLIFVGGTLSEAPDDYKFDPPPRVTQVTKRRQHDDRPRGSSPCRPAFLDGAAVSARSFAGGLRFGTAERGRGEPPAQDAHSAIARS